MSNGRCGVMLPIRARTTYARRDHLANQATRGSDARVICSWEWQSSTNLTVRMAHQVEQILFNHQLSL